MKISNLLFSFKTTLTLLFILAAGAGYATFIENDFGTSTARVLVYNNIWYETILVLTTVNLTGIIFKYKMYKNTARFLFHSSFVIILLGAGITRYFGYEGIMQIKEGTTENRMQSLEPYLQINVSKGEDKFYEEHQLEFAASTLRKGMEIADSTGIIEAIGNKLNQFDYNVNFAPNENIHVKYVDFTVSKQGKADMGLLSVEVTYKGETQSVRLPGKRGQIGVPRELMFGDTKVNLVYGSKPLEIPFAIRLNDFQLDRYPGSNSPSSYASEVTVIKEDGQKYDYRIFMNRTMHEGNYLFFQSSYFPDETGTVLSVNNDPGKWPTYLGYLILTIGFVLNFFDKKSRFAKLTKFVSTKDLASIAVAALLSFGAVSSYAQEANQENNQAQVQEQQQAQQEFMKQLTPKEMADYLNKYKEQSAATADKFSKLVVQDHQGRMKPMSSMNRDIVSKISRKSEFLGMNYDQIVLGMLARPDIWKDVKIINVKTPQLKKFLEIPEDRKYIAFSEVFKNNKYILASEVEKANQVKVSERGTYERDVIKVDERINIVYAVFNGALFNIFPQVPTQNNTEKMDNSKWYSPLDAINTFDGMNQTAVQSMIRGVVQSVSMFDWEKANTYIGMIKTYQEKIGSDVNLTKSEIENEILFNKLDLFPKLTLAYLFLGLVMIVAAFITVFKPQFKSKKMTFVFFALLFILFSIQTFGMGFRWIISGHAPWSDLYESLLYISWSAIFAGVVFFRRSLLALSASIIVAAIFMFTAHLTGIDPQITNLVPVLKSYWLTIHVSILTASYGFFGLSAIIGFMTLIMFIFRKNRPHIDENIKHITAINEISLIIGLSAVTIGNFLGGVWANESWGRYWGWDPKETWAYVSIVIYAIVLHLRFVPKLNNPYTFATASLVSFGSILMTYFGVNFYLSGMHSYATGDPVPIPTWVYVVVAAVIITIFLAYKNRNLKDSISNS